MNTKRNRTKKVCKKCQYAPYTNAYSPYQKNKKGHLRATATCQYAQKRTRLFLTIKNFKASLKRHSPRDEQIPLS